MRWLLIVVAVAGCKSKGPNTPSPEDTLLWELGNKLVANDRDGVIARYDLDGRQRTELWEKTIRKLAKPEDQNAALAAARPRLGEPAALVTVGEEAYRELDNVVAAATAQDLADGKCVSRPPDAGDIGRWVMPKEQQGMPQELGLYAFETRTAFDWVPALRVRCPTGELWAQMARRKDRREKDPLDKEHPLRMLRVER